MIHEITLVWIGIVAAYQARSRLPSSFLIINDHLQQFVIPEGTIPSPSRESFVRLAICGAGKGTADSARLAPGVFSFLDTRSKNQKLMAKDKNEKKDAFQKGVVEIGPGASTQDGRVKPKNCSQETFFLLEETP